MPIVLSNNQTLFATTQNTEIYLQLKDIQNWYHQIWVKFDTKKVLFGFNLKPLQNYKRNSNLAIKTWFLVFGMSKWVIQ